ncbi:MAG TPA: Gfo/Idh/MocA family oxidoreductase [Terriglobales bacterium]|nr:Gfo/Idh/MocA family oxidoreductase [Terriglobales bacterium]
MVRFGILGFGHHAAKRLMPGFASAKQCTVRGFWRRDQSKAKEVIGDYRELSLRSYETPEALCAAPDVDAIFIASPDALHLEHVLLAVKHGKPVLCEKPLAMNAKECERMIEAAEIENVRFGVAQVFRFEPSVNHMRELVSSGAIGKPLLARSEFHYLAQHSPRTWLTDAALACGGPIGDVAVHCIDALRYILQDEVHEVYTRAQYDDGSGAVESAAMLMLQFTRGTIAEVTVSTRAEYRTPLWITGDAGRLGAEDALNVEHAIQLTCQPMTGESSVEQLSNENAYAEQVDAFARWITNGVPFPAPAMEGLRNQHVLDAAYRSIHSGKSERVPIHRASSGK